MKDLIKNIKENKSHHFYIIEGEKESILNEIKADTDFIINEFSRDRFLIEDSRSVVDKTLIKNSKEQKQLIILSFNSITPEAQNSLLKVVEEPTPGTYFFMIVPNVNIFLPTIISRAVIIKSEGSGIENEFVKKILSGNVGERIKIVEKVAKDISDSKLEKQIAKEIVEGIIEKIRKENQPEKLKELMKIRSYLDLTGASIKMLLERAVLVL